MTKMNNTLVQVQGFVKRCQNIFQIPPQPPVRSQSRTTTSVYQEEADFLFTENKA